MPSVDQHYLSVPSTPGPAPYPPGILTNICTVHVRKIYVTPQPEEVRQRHVTFMNILVLIHD